MTLPHRVSSLVKNGGLSWHLYLPALTNTYAFRCRLQLFYLLLFLFIYSFIYIYNI